MSKDLGKSFIDQDTAYHIRNYKLTTDRGLSTVNLTSESGNQLSFKLAEYIPSKDYTNDDGDVLESVPSLNGSELTIIGVTTIVDDIVLFSTNDAGIGQIWWVKYDYVSDQVIGLIGGQYLDPAIHLIYNRQLGFSTAHRIKAVGKYETSTITRIYWTDFFNPVRTLNLMKPDVEPGLLAINSIVNMSQPNILLTGAGNLPAGTMVQFTYRLFDSNGNLTAFAPMSELYPLPLSSLLSDAWIDISGDGDPTVDTNKSITYEIKGIDLNYEFIEHVIVIYTAPDVYTAYSYADRQVPSDGYIKITCSDVDNAVVIDPVELNMLSSAFDVAKDIEIKDTRLIAINTKSTPFDINFDARTYRFNSGQNARIEEEDGTLPTNFPTGIDGIAASIAWPNLTDDAELDCINPYNNENDNSWGGSSQYKYQSDGTTLGGEGPRIKYKFVKHDVVADYTAFSTITTAPPHVVVTRYGFSPGESLGVIERNQTGRVLVKTSHFPDGNSAYIPAYYRGYARGEVYRFGIVFFSKTHQPSFVKWIGDIRFPEPCETGHMGEYALMTTSGFSSVMNSIGLEFQVDISGFEDQISGFQIVRVQRSIEDRTRLGTGMLMDFSVEWDDWATSLMGEWESANGGGVTANWTDDVDIYGVTETNALRLSSYPGRINITHRSLISPMNQEYEVNKGSNDFIKTFGYYESKPQLYHNGGQEPDNDDTWGFYYRLKDFVDITTAAHGQEYFQIDYMTIARVGEYFDSGSEFAQGLAAPYTSVRNTTFSRDVLLGPAVPLGLGSQKSFLRLSTGASVTLANCFDPTGGGESWNGIDTYSIGLTFVGNTGDDVYFKEVAYCRYLNNQYGGSDYVSRQTNQYISTGHFQPIDEDVLSTVSSSINGSTITNLVFGGDVFVNYFDDEYVQMYRAVESAYKEPYSDPRDAKYSLAVLCPVESPVNTDFILGNRFASNRDATNMSAYENNSYEYNNVFSQENTTEQKFFAQDALIEINNEHRHRVWASEQKTDGELIDNWRQFKVGNSIEVNGTHGGLNRVINFRDQMYFYQDKAFGALAIDKEAVIPDEFGVEMTLGKGRTLDFGYISQTTGAFHQWGVINSDNALYHFDARLKRLFRFNGQSMEDLSAVKGFTSHFDKIDGELLTTDQTILGKGIETVWDNRNNRLLFTFLNHKKISSVPPEEYLEFREGDIFIKDGSYYYIDDYSSHFRQGFEDYFPSEINGILLNDYIHGETIGYNEIFDCFESFYDYKPGLYINTNRSLFSVSPFDGNSTWIHNRKTLYNSYYGFTYPYEVESVLLGQEGLTHVFNNVIYQDECFNPYGKDIYDRSFNKYKARNEYQNTGYINLTDDNYKRRMRASHFKIGRDLIDGKSRMRSPWMRLKLVLDNHDGNIRHILHNLIYSYNSNNY